MGLFGNRNEQEQAEDQQSQDKGKKSKSRRSGGDPLPGPPYEEGVSGSDPW